MEIVIIVLGVMFLIGMPVGKALAICSIIEGGCIVLKGILEKYTKNREKEIEIFKKEVDKTKTL